MIKLKYAVFEALISFCRHRYVNLIVAVSFALGMLLPMLCLGNINIFAENSSTMRYVDDETVWIASFEGESPSLSEIEASLQKSTVKVNRYAISAYRRETVDVEGTKKSTFVSCLSDDWQTFERCKVISCICVIFGIWEIYPTKILKK